MKTKTKKNIVITKKEHDEWHRKNGYENKSDREHDLCHKRCGIIVKK